MHSPVRQVGVVVVVAAESSARTVFARARAFLDFLPGAAGASDLFARAEKSG